MILMAFLSHQKKNALEVISSLEILCIVLKLVANLQLDRVDYLWKGKKNLLKLFKSESFQMNL